MIGERDGVVPTSRNVFLDLGLSDPAARLAEANLAHSIRSRIREYGLYQTQAAERSGTIHACMFEVMNCKLGKMSYELLLDYLVALDCDVQITILPHPPVAEATQKAVHEAGPRTGRLGLRTP